MKQRLFSRLFIVLPAVLCLSIISVGNTFAAEPVTIRYEVTSYQTNLGFVSYRNGTGSITELLSEGTTTWSYQFTTANVGQPVSVYPVPVDNPHAAISIVSKVYLNGILYKTATGPNAAAASINDTLGNLLTAGPTHQWAISYQVTAEQANMGLVTYSNNHTLDQSEILAAGTTMWNYQYTATNTDQPIKIEAEPVVPNDPNKFYTVVIKVFVNNDLLYYATFNPNTQPAVVDVKLGDLLAGRASQARLQSSDEYFGVQEVRVIKGTSPAPAVPNMSANYAAVSTNQPYVINFKQMMFGDSGQIRTAGFSFFTNDRFIFVTIGTSPQPLEVPEFQTPPGTMIALAPQQ